MEDATETIAFVAITDGGNFYSDLSGARINIRQEDGRFLRVERLPDGSWPFALAKHGDRFSLYFTYFLSATVGKWVLDQSGIKVSASQAIHLRTSHGTFVATDPSDGRLKHVPPATHLDHRLVDMRDALADQELVGGLRDASFIPSGPLAGYTIQIRRTGPSKRGKAGEVHLAKRNQYLCASPDNEDLVCDRLTADTWETFKLVGAQDDDEVTSDELSDLSAFVSCSSSAPSGTAPAQARWLHSKFVSRTLVPDAYEPNDLSSFQRLERLAALTVLQSGTRTRNASVALGLTKFSSELKVGLVDAVHLTNVPPERYTYLQISASELPAGRAVSSVLCEKFEISFLSKFFDIIENLNVAEAEIGIRYDLGGFADIDAEEVIVRPTQPLDHHGCFQQLNITFSASITENDSTSAHFFGRITPSLMSLGNFLGMFFDRSKGGSSLHFHFGDSGAVGCISFDRRKGQLSPLIPDLYILESARERPYFARPGFRAFRDEFESKLPVVFWRGATTGAFEQSIDDIARNPRVRACVKIWQTLGAKSDVKISNVTQVPFSLHAGADELIEQLGVKAPRRVTEREFGRYQMYIDLPGNASAWGTYRKYLMGCLVIRPDHQSELFYYRFLDPWVHFVPVSPTLDDLPDVVDWVLRNPAAAARIAYAGRNQMIEIIEDIPNTLMRTFRDAADHDAA